MTGTGCILASRQGFPKLLVHHAQQQGSGGDGVAVGEKPPFPGYSFSTSECYENPSQ